MTNGRRERAAARRASWEGEVVVAGQPKGRLYASLAPSERLAALARLNWRAWIAGGGAELPPLARADWPGEIFEIDRD